MYLKHIIHIYELMKMIRRISLNNDYKLVEATKFRPMILTLGYYLRYYKNFKIFWENSPAVVFALIHTRDDKEEDNNDLDPKLFG